MADPIGIQGRGRAGIFGTGSNPLAVIQQNQAAKIKRADQILEEERKNRDKLVDDFRKFNPDEVWSPFYQEINQDVQAKVRDPFYQMRNERQPIAAVQKYLDRAYGDINTKVAKINWMKDQHKEAMDTIESNDVGKFYKQSQTKRAVNDVFFNGRAARPSSEIDADQIQGVFDNPDNFDVNAISIDFMKSVPDKVNQKYTEEWGKYGQQYDVQETKTKIGIQTIIGPDGRETVVLDKRTGLPKIGMTDEVYIQAMQNPYLSKVVEKYVPDGDQQKEKEFLTGLLEGLDPASIQSRPQMGFRKPEDEIRYSAYGRGFRMPIADLEDRDSRLEKIVNDGRPELLEGLSDPNSDNQAYYANKDGQPIKPGQKPEMIVLARVGTAETEEGIPFSEMSPEQRIDYFMKEVTKGRILKENKIPIATAEDKRRAKIAMSLRLDKMDGKRSIGEEYSNFVEAKYQDQITKNKGKAAPKFDFSKYEKK